MEKIIFDIKRIVFQNKENNYCIIRASVKNKLIEDTVVGYFYNARIDSTFEAEGEWIIDPKYGKQFKAESSTEVLPATIKGIKGYLASGLIKGIGPINAEKIVAHFKERTLDIIENEPERLKEISGISDKKVETIKKGWQENQGMKYLIMFLQENDISPSIATKIFAQYNNNSINVLKDNPYRLCDDVFGIGFLTADKIAEKLGIDKTKYVRLRSGILYTLKKQSDFGHCFLQRPKLLKESIDLLGVEEHLIIMTIDEMNRTHDIIIENDNIYLNYLYHTELNVENKLKILLNTKKSFEVAAPVDDIVDRIEYRNKIKYDKIQRDAINLAIKSKVMILTGGPGTGKTTTVNGIISVFENLGLKVILTSPTGKAAKRLAEMTKREAKTIHRLLEYSPMGGYNKNSLNPLVGDVIIIDETSMIDISLINNLLQAVPSYMTVIFVGDINQLPSIGPGNVLKDLINSKLIPCIELKRIYRQEFESLIVDNAYALNNGQELNYNSYEDGDFVFIEKLNPKEIIDTIMDICDNDIPLKYKLNPMYDIQILTPMQKGDLGSLALNEKLQEALNPDSKFVERNGIKYREKDKVIQIKNNYEKEVFNGDIGIIKNIDEEDQSVMVEIDGKYIFYDFNELNQLQLAYALTIHKSQGSEFPYVVIPVSSIHYMMLQRNLLYTAMTRAKKMLFMIGEKKAVRIASNKIDMTQRNTTLFKRNND